MTAVNNEEKAKALIQFTKKLMDIGKRRTLKCLLEKL